MGDELGDYNPFAQSEPISDLPSTIPQYQNTATPQYYQPPLPTGPINTSSVSSSSMPRQAPPAAAPAYSNPAFVDPILGMIPISEAEMAAREAELSRKELEIARQESLVANGIPVESVGLDNRPKNFPPLLKIWKYYPEKDIPSDHLGLLRQIFWLFIFISLTYVANWIGCFCCFAAGDALASVGTLVVLSTIYLFVFVPLSYECSFFVLYNSLKEEKGLTYFCFLFTFAVWGVVVAWHTIGIDEGGSVGWIQMINLFSGGHGVVAFVALIVSIAFTVCVAGIIYLWWKCWRYYQTNGLSKKAFGEASSIAAQYAAENPDVVADVAMNAQAVHI